MPTASLLRYSMTYHKNKLPAVFLFLKHSLMDENHLRKKINKLREKEN